MAQTRRKDALMSAAKYVYAALAKHGDMLQEPAAL